MPSSPSNAIPALHPGGCGTLRWILMSILVGVLVSVGAAQVVWAQPLAPALGIVQPTADQNPTAAAYAYASGPTALQPQTPQSPFRSQKRAQSHHGFLFQSSFTPRDVYLGFQAAVGLPTQGLDVAVLGSFDFRPAACKVLVQDGPVYYQFRERRYFPSLGAEIRYFLVPDIVGLYGSARGGFFFGNYRGSRQRPSRGFMAAPAAGIAFHFAKVVQLRLGYEYFNQLNDLLPAHRVAMGFGFMW